MNILHTLGLMKRSEQNSKLAKARTAETLEQHIMDVNIAKSDAEWWAKRAIEALRTERDDWQQKHNSVVGKIKRAATGLAAQTEEIGGLMEIADYRAEVIEQLQDEIAEMKSSFNQRLADAVQDYEADALAMRKKRAADRKRMAGKRGKGQ